MTTNFQRPGFLSTRRSVAVFSVTLCLAVAGATETVFAYLNHELDTDANLEVSEATTHRAHMSSETQVPGLFSRVGADDAAQASDGYLQGPSYAFSSVQTSINEPVANPATTSQDNVVGLRSVTTSSLAAGREAPNTASTALPQPAVSAVPTVSSAQLPAVVTVQCGNARCSEGDVCCNASCGTCARPGEQCSQLVCGMSTTLVSYPCGSNTCSVGESCCNASCGICARPGEPCDANQECDNPIQYPYSAPCGMATCNVGTVCCNPSCGICARFGEPCSQNACD